MSGGDVIADCGRLGPDGPQYDLVAQAAVVLLVTRPNAGDVIRLRDRAAAVASAVNARGRRGFTSSVAVLADQRTLRATAAEVGQALAQGNVPAAVAGGLADDPKGAELLRGEWGGRLDKTLLIRTAREIAQQLAASLPAARDDRGPGPAAQQTAVQQTAAQQTAVQQPAAPRQQYQAAPQYPPPGQQPQPPAAPQYLPGQQRGTGGRHATSVQPAEAGREAGEGQWTTA